MGGKDALLGLAWLGIWVFRSFPLSALMGLTRHHYLYLPPFRFS